MRINWKTGETLLKMGSCTAENLCVSVRLKLDAFNRNHLKPCCLNTSFTLLADCTAADDVTVAMQVCERNDNMGVHAHPCDCFKFIECSQTTLPLTRTCSPFFFDAESHVCDVSGSTECSFSQDIGSFS